MLCHRNASDGMLPGVCILWLRRAPIVYRYRYRFTIAVAKASP